MPTFLAYADWETIPNPNNNETWSDFDLDTIGCPSDTIGVIVYAERPAGQTQTTTYMKVGIRPNGSTDVHRGMWDFTHSSGESRGKRTIRAVGCDANKLVEVYMKSELVGCSFKVIGWIHSGEAHMLTNQVSANWITTNVDSWNACDFSAAIDGGTTLNTWIVNVCNNRWTSYDFGIRPTGDDYARYCRFIYETSGTFFCEPGTSDRVDIYLSDLNDYDAYTPGYFASSAGYTGLYGSEIDVLPPSQNSWQTVTATGVPANAVVCVYFDTGSGADDFYGLRAVGSSDTMIYDLYNGPGYYLVHLDDSSQLQAYQEQSDTTSSDVVGYFTTAPPPLALVADDLAGTGQIQQKGISTTITVAPTYTEIRSVWGEYVSVDLTNVPTEVEGNTFVHGGLQPDTLYGYRVRVVAADDSVSEWSDELWVTTEETPIPALADPTSPSISDIQSTSLIMNWAYSGSGHTGFEVDVDSGGGYTLYDTVDVAVRSKQVTSLPSETFIQVRVRAVSDTQQSNYVSASGTTLAEAPDPLEAPTNFRVTTTAVDNLWLQWDYAGQDHTNFGMERIREGIDGDWTHVTSSIPVQDRSYTMLGLPADTRVDLRLKAIGLPADSDWAITFGTTDAESALAAPYSQGTSSITETSFWFYWSYTDGDQTGFDVEKKTSGVDGSYVSVASVSSGTRGYSISGLPSDTLTEVRVRATSATQESSWVYSSATTLEEVEPPTSLPAPTNFRVTAVYDTSFDLAWDYTSPAEHTGWRLEKKSSGVDGDYVLDIEDRNSAATRTYTITGLPQGTLTDLRLKATGTVEDSAWSYTSGTTTAPSSLEAPTSPGTSSVADTSFYFYWTYSGSSQTGFEIQKKTAGVHSVFVAVTTVGSSTRGYTLSGLPEGTLTEVRVRATNATQASSWAYSSATTTGGTPPPSSGTKWNELLWYEDWEGYSTGANVENLGAGYEVGDNSYVTTDRAYKGSKSCSTWCAVGDTGYGRWGWAKRTPKVMCDGSECWLRAAVWFPTNYNFTTSAGVLKLLRLHTTTDQDELWNDCHIKSESPHTLSLKNHKTVNGTVNLQANIALGAWTLIEIYRVLHPTEGTAQTRVWVNGQRVKNEFGSYVSTLSTGKATNRYADYLYWHTYWNDGANGTWKSYIDDIAFAVRGNISGGGYRDDVAAGRLSTDSSGFPFLGV